MKILLTGGSACGKSTFAEKLAVELPPPRYYVATMEPYGEEGQARIRRHHAMRQGKGFTTIERYVDAAGLRLPEHAGVILLECVGNLLANEMFRPDGAKDAAVEAVLSGVENLDGQCDNLIIVTNEVGSGGNDSFNDGTLAYIELMGRVNRRLAAFADRAAEMVCGIPVMLKGEQL